VNTAVTLFHPDELVEDIAVSSLIKTIEPAVDALYQMALMLKEPLS
jgi:hypothetical protein